jgi:hypothetical protein
MSAWLLWLYSWRTGMWLLNDMALFFNVVNGMRFHRAIERIHDTVSGCQPVRAG